MTWSRDNSKLDYIKEALKVSLLPMATASMGSHFVQRVENFSTFSARSWIRNMYIFHMVSQLLDIFLTEWTNSRPILERS